MNLKLKLYFLILILFACPAFPQTTYYVSPDGDDSDSGISIEDAFESLQQAAEIVVPGDSVLVLVGTYTGFDLRTGGTSSLPIVFKALGQNVTINLTNPVTNDGINIESADWIVIDGFKVINQPRAGIRIVTSDFVIIRNNHCTENYRWGIFTGFTDNILIENNTCALSEDEHGIYVSNSGDNPVVRNNTCFANNGCGIQLNADASMGDDGIITNAIIEGNILYDNGNGGGAAINLDGVQESVIFNNLLYNNLATGIALFQIDGAEGSRNNKVYNNTIVNPENSRWAILVNTGSTGDTLYNNILINHHSFRGSISIDESSEQGFVSDNNIIVNRLSDDDGESNMSLSEWQSLGYDIHSLIALPEEQIFANHTAGNFHLLENSQASNTGTNLVSDIVLNDLDNLSRPQGTGYDIGAYEFTNPAGIKNDDELPSGFALYQNYPNPFNPVTSIQFVISNRQFVSLNVYDILGNKVAALVNEAKPAGLYQVEFEASNLSSGIYFYRLETEEFISTKKMILLQ
jgi:parallel beta-helix repeat protein